MAWLLIALLAAATLFVGWKGGRVAMAAAAAIVLGWTATAALVASDYRDVDGFFDCGIHCTTLQDVVGFVAFVGPVLLVILLLGSLAGLSDPPRQVLTQLHDGRKLERWLDVPPRYPLLARP